MIKLPTSTGSQKKQGRKFQKNICFTVYTKAFDCVDQAFDCVDHNKLENGIPDHFACLLRNLDAGQKAIVRTLHRKTDQFKTGKGVQGCILSLFYLTYKQSIPCKMLGWMTHKLELRLLGEITSDTTFTAESKEELWSLLMRVKEKSERAGLKLNIQKTKVMASGPITSQKTDVGKAET